MSRYACEWNPTAVSALQANLALNGVAEKCTVLAGDCRLVAPTGVADRVNLGLLPSSEMAWEAAVRALKPPPTPPTHPTPLTHPPTTGEGTGARGAGVGVGVAENKNGGAGVGSGGGGGWLHVHANCVEDGIAAWVDGCVSALDAIALRLGRKCRFLARHTEKVKWYAPRIRHIVVDVQCVPLT